MRLLRFPVVALLGLVALPACAADDARIAPSDQASVPRESAGAASPGTTVAGETSGAPRRVMVGGIDLTGIGYDKGRLEAPIVIVEFSDFGCPFCGSHARETWPTLERDYVATGKVFYKYVPFVMGMFPNGQQAARAAECAGEQGRFWPMHDLLYARQPDWKKTLSPSQALGGYAATLGLDAAKFRACYLANEPHHPRTRAANERADRFGVRATPSFLINDRPVEGALPLPQFRELLDGVAAGRK